MEIFTQLFSALNRNRVRYLVAGGVAVNLYGIERATADIDIVLLLDEKNVQSFISVARELGLRPKVPVKLDDLASEEKRNIWINDKGMTVFSLHDPERPFFLLDIFVEMPFDFDKVYARRERMRAGRTTVPVVPIEELIRMKEKSDRPQDRADIHYLKKIRNG